MPDEIIDIVNNNDNVIGQELRSVAHRHGLQHRGVNILLITPERRLIVQQRSKQQETFPNALDCSVSEHVKAGESYQQAAKRGLQEELGIRDLQIKSLIKLKMEYSPNDFEICILYEGRVDPKLIHFDPLEVKNVTSYQLDELVELIHNGEVAFTPWLVQIINWYLEKPSILEVIEIYTHDRLLLSK